MKTRTILILLFCFSPLVLAQDDDLFDYPALIKCKPSVHLSVNINEGIHKSKHKIEQHDFEYIANGKFRFAKDSWGSGQPPVFDSGLSHENSVINIYSGSVVYSIALYAERYVMASVLPGKTTNATLGVSANVIEGACEVKW